MTHPEVVEVGTGTPAVRAVFTTRRGGVSQGPFASLNLSAATGDSPERVRANRAAVAAALGFDPVRAVVLDQVHGADVRVIGAEGGDGTFLAPPAGLAAADASVCEAPGVALLAMGADCPGVLVWSADGTCVAAVHAGWRGLVAGVIEAAVAAMRRQPAHLRAVIGPGVRPCCYPVDTTLRATMADRFGRSVVVGDSVDLVGASRTALVQCGVPSAAVSAVGACTRCDGERFHSYRRDGGVSGRHAGIIWRVETPA